MEFLSTHTLLYPLGLPHLVRPTRLLPRPSLTLRRRRIPPSRVPRNLVATFAVHPEQEGGHELVIPDYIVPSGESPSLVDQTVMFPESLSQTLYVEKDAELAVESVSLVKIPPKVDKRSQNRKMLAEVMAIAIPALGTVLADPLMSLVDTACVGQISAVQLAALGPNTAIFNFIFTAFSFIGSAVANVLATNSLKVQGLDPEEARKRRDFSETLLSHSLVVALTIGSLMAGFLFLSGSRLLQLMGTGPAVMSAALQYLLIRAIASPAVLFIAVSQGACLGQQDMWTPMKVVATAGVLNLIGDMILIIGCKMGTMGAAIATAGAQIAGAIYFYWYLRHGVKENSALKLKWKGIPTKASVKPLLEMGRVFLVRNMVLMLSYTVMTAVATMMGTLTLAAHQVTLQLFWFLSFIPEPLSLTGQSLIARDKEDKAKIKNLSYVLMKFGCTSGLALAATFGIMLTFMARFFSSDVSVIMEFQKVIPHGMFALFLTSVSNMFDGICIGIQQIEQLPRIIYLSTGATLGFLWLAQRHQLGLSGVWTAVIVFFFTRCFFQSEHLLRNWKMTPFGAFIPTPTTTFVETQEAAAA